MQNDGSPSKLTDQLKKVGPLGGKRLTSGKNSSIGSSTIMNESIDGGISTKNIWSNLSKEVNRTFLHVDTQIQENKLWLYSLKCDLNDLQKSILQAFNIDIRKSEFDSKDIKITHNGVSYVCHNGIFMK